MRKEMLILGNLTCPTCAADLERALRRMDGVREASVAFATGALDVVYDEEVVDGAQIERTLAGFGVTVAARL